MLPRPRSSPFAILGSVLIVASAIGLFTVADELRHTGELFGVLAVLLCGVSLVLAGLCPRLSPVVALQWAPVGILLGALVGSVVDRVVVGVLAGSLLGILLARRRRTRAA